VGSPQRADFRDPDVERLSAALDAELEGLYGRPDQDQPAAGTFDDGVFLVVRDENDPTRPAVSRGGVKPHAPGVGEVKRMYTRPQLRGQGLGRAVLDGLVDWAREAGLHRLILETGTRQHAALAMYERAGWERIEPFAPYEDEPDSVCFGRSLSGR
jgi:GNAT superfamily N-acetyltransferase